MTEITKPKRRRKPAITINLDPEARARIEAQAREAGMSTSGYVRERLLRPQQARHRERMAAVRSLSEIAQWLAMRGRFSGPGTAARIDETLVEVRAILRDMRDGVL